MSAAPYRIAILGNPHVPETRFDAPQLEALRRLGFNTVQLNIAWGSRPPGEPLNLEDLFDLSGGEPVPNAGLAEMRRRAKACRQYGLRTLFHYGAPHVKGLYNLWHKGLEKGQAVEACLLKPETTQHCRQLLQAFAAACPEVDDILIYCCDQEAWVCSEFGDCPRCHGIPLAERLPAFLRALWEVWSEARPQGTMWYEPWELSAGQIYQMLPQLPRRQFGLMLHSNIAEVQATRPVDVWFRNTARWCASLGIPVVGEVFMAGATEEVGWLQRVTAPRLVWQQLEAVSRVPGVSGVKEYFGLRPDLLDPNLEVAGLFFAGQAGDSESAVRTVAERFGVLSEPLMRAWEAAATALELFPWDTCWGLRSFLSKWAWILNAWGKFRIYGHLVDSPSWCSTRRSHFMTTENDELHPWFYEDFALRCKASADAFARAIAAYDEALKIPGAPHQADVAAWREDLTLLHRYVRRFHCYAAEELLARHLRQAKEKTGQLPTALLARMRELLEMDVVNLASVEGGQTAKTVLAELNRDPAAWLEKYFR